MAADPEAVPGLGTAAVKAFQPLHGHDGSPARASRERAPIAALLERAAATDAATSTRWRPSARSRRRGAARTSTSSSTSPREYDVGTARREPPSLAGFLQQISLVADADTRDDDEGLVTLMTLHNAKGLEYPIVFIIGCEEGVFPHSRALDEGGARGGASPLLRRHHARAARPLHHLCAAADGLRRAPLRCGEPLRRRDPGRADRPSGAAVGRRPRASDLVGLRLRLAGRARQRRRDRVGERRGRGGRSVVPARRGRRAPGLRRGRRDGRRGRRHRRDPLRQ